MKRLGLVLCCAAATGAIAPAAATAGATTTTVSSGALTVNADTGTANTITLSLVAGSVRVTDTAGITNINCTFVNSTTSDCIASSITVIAKDFGDSVTVNSGITQPTTMLGGSGTDTLTGAGEADTFDEGTSGTGDGGDIFNGGGGTDTVTYASRSTAVAADIDGVADDGQAGENDNVKTDIENLTGSSAADSLTGNGSANSLDGQAGDDTLTGGLGADAFTGGADVDTASFADHAGAVTADIDNVGDDGSNCPGVSCEGDNVTLGIENLTGGAEDDNLTGTGSVNVLTGGAGADTFTPGDSGDTVNGDDGNDTIIEDSNTDVGDVYNGGGDNDTADYSAGNAVTIDLDNVADDGSGIENDNVKTDIENVTGGAFGDTIAGSFAQNRLIGGGGGDTLISGEAADDLEGGGGTDTASYEDRSAGNAVVATLGTTVGNGVAGSDGVGDDLSDSIENLRGGLGGDTLTGDGNVNLIFGGGGADVLAGAAGDDQLNGELGNDTLDEGALSKGVGADTLDGGDDTDTVSYDGRSSGTPITAGIGGGADGAAGEGDTIQSDVESIEGGEGDDVLTGDFVENTLTGNGGNDMLVGDVAADVLDGGLGTDTVSYDDGHAGVSATIGTSTGNGNGSDGVGDNLTGGIDNLIGGDGNDILTGDGAANTLSGGNGDDTLTGGAQSDVLNGNADNDTFFEDGAPNGADVFNGGSGAADLADYAGRTSSLTVDIDGVADDGQAGENDNVKTDVERLNGGTAADSFAGSSAVNSIIGGPGGDTFDEGAAANGADSFVGGLGTDTITYASRTAAVLIREDNLGNDGQAGENDSIAADIENLTGGSGDDLLGGTSTNGNANVYSGGAGTDTVDYFDAAGIVTADIDGAPGDDGQSCPSSCELDTIQLDIENIKGTQSAGNNLTGSSGPNVLTGAGGSDALNGAGGGDTLNGGLSQDTLDGGPGDDLLDGDFGQDVLNGGSEVDTVTYASRAAAVTADPDGVFGDDGELGETDTIGTDIENLTGGSGADALTGDGNDNVLTGGAGADTLNLLAGADVANAQDGVIDTIDCTGGGADSGSFDTAPLENFVSCANGDGDSVPDLADACPSQSGSQADGCPPPVVNPPATTAPPAKKCKKGQKLKKGKCVKKKRKRKGRR